MLNEKFRNPTSPVLPDVKLKQAWGYYDGPLFGVCEVHGQRLFFADVLYDTWQWFTDDDMDRGWRVYAVYDMTEVEAKDMIDNTSARSQWQDSEDMGDAVGIFWEYEKKWDKGHRE